VRIVRTECVKQKVKVAQICHAKQKLRQIPQHSRSTAIKPLYDDKIT